MKNNKGFSTVELLAVIVIINIILLPLLTTFVRNIEINDYELVRSSSINIAEGTLYGINKLDYTDIYNLLEGENTGGAYYLELNKDNCDILAASDEIFCDAIFGSIHNNLVLDATTFRVFFYDYNMTINQLRVLTDNIGDVLPQKVVTEIENQPITNGSLESLIRVTVWINQNQDPMQYTVISGLIYDD